MASVSVFDTTRFTALAAGDVIPAVDVSNTTQNAHGSLLSITITNFFASVPVPVNVTSASATSFAVGRLGATTPAFQVDSSTGSQVAGLKVTGAVTGGTVAVVVIDSGADANLTVNAKGTGTIGIGTVSTGRVTITPVVTITGSLTLSAALIYGGVTLSNAVTGTGNMVLSVSPTLTGTITVTGATITGLTAASVAAGTFPAGAYVFASGGVTVTSGGLTVSAGTTAVQALTATTVTASSGPNGFAGTVRSTATTNPGTGTGAELSWDGTNGYFLAIDRATTTWKPIKVYGSTVALGIAGTDKLTVNADGSVTSAAGIAATTGTFSDNVSIAATKRLILNGATANTFIEETSSGLLTVDVGGVIALQLNSSTDVVSFGSGTTWTVVTNASAAARAGLRIPPGSAPTSPTSGDIWYDGTNLKFRDGVTTRTITWT